MQEANRIAAMTPETPGGVLAKLNKARADRAAQLMPPNDDNA
jgi:hypothetical protein